MPRYSYKLISKDNKVLEGSLTAASEMAAHQTLLAEEVTLLAFAKIGEQPFFRKEIKLPVFGFSKPDQIFFFRNLSTMLTAGLSVAEALRVLEEQQSSVGIRKAIQSLIGDVENGQKLSAAMKKFPQYFSSYITETVNVGEITGKSSDILDRIAEDLEHDYELTRKVQGAMAYPVIVLCVMIGVMGMLTLVVLPKIADLFKEINAPLPLPTKLLLDFSAFVRAHPFGLVAVLFGLIAAAYGIWRNKKGRLLLHTFLLKLPLFGELVKEYNLTRFFRALELLYESGVSLVRSVEIAKMTLKNDAYRGALDTAYPVLIHGAPLSDALKNFPQLFPLQTRRIIEVGERTGKLEEIFLRICGYYERALRHKTQMLASMIEPILMVLIGVVVGGLALSVFLPIYQSTNAF